MLKTIKPTKKETEAEISFSKKVIKNIKKVCPKHKLVLVGSVAKGTFLQDSKDLDIFILVNKKTHKSELEKMLISIMSKAYPDVGYQLSYAEHPYVRFHLENRQVDLVPAYNIKNANERVSAVDRSVLHTSYILKNLKSSQRDDTLLLKKFLKANSLYGAEIKIAGFSGYLCELLILSAGSFTNLIRKTAKWKFPLLIDLEKYYKLKSEKQQLFSYFDSSFVVIDPTDKKRNVAAAVSEKNLKMFVRLCKRFTKKPSKSFFLKKPTSFEAKLSKAKNRGHIYIVSIPKPNVVSDVLWGQLRKLMKQLTRELTDFQPLDIFADDEKKVQIALLLKTDLLPKTMLLPGPPLDMKKHVIAFKKNHKNTKFLKKHKKINAIIKRKIRDPKTLLTMFFKKFQKQESHLAYPLSKIKITKLS